MRVVSWTADVTDGTTEAASGADAGTVGDAARTGLADLGVTAEVTGAVAGMAGSAAGAAGPVTGAGGLDVAAGVTGAGTEAPDGVAGAEVVSVGFGVVTEVTVATAHVTERAAESVPELVTGAAGFGAVTGATDAGAADGGGDVAACACRENTNRTASMPTATIAACIARRAMRSNVAWDTGNSRSAGRDTSGRSDGASRTLLTQNLHARHNFRVFTGIEVV